MIISDISRTRLSFVLFISMILCSSFCIAVDQKDNKKASIWKGWKTNTEKRTIELDELMSGGPGKNGIPSINKPEFVEIASLWGSLAANEPVISIAIEGNAKAYPLQILMWHEIVNDKLSEVPITVTFCPLCYSAIVYERIVDGKEYTFGVSGFLRNSDLVMYDLESETLWQQCTGEAIVGELVGKKLKQIPSQIISFGQFRKAWPKGKVLSKETGFKRNYGKNPYVGYDNIDARPFLFRGKTDGRMKPMARIITIGIEDKYRAYPHDITRRTKVINDKLLDRLIVVFHDDGAVSAVDKSSIKESSHIGSTGVFSRTVDAKQLTFKYKDKEFVDEQTNSVWDITGRAIKGAMKGTQLKPINHEDTFAFVWFAFRPETDIYKAHSDNQKTIDKKKVK